MAVVDGRTHRGSVKENSLPFEGFMEALGRIAVLKALPTDAELAQSGCSDAGVFMQKLQASTLSASFIESLGLRWEPGWDALTAFQRSRAAGWGETSLAQPLARCLHHTICCIIRTIEEDSHGADDMSLKLSEVKNWMSRKVAA